MARQPICFAKPRKSPLQRQVNQPEIVSLNRRSLSPTAASSIKSTRCATFGKFRCCIWHQAVPKRFGLAARSSEKIITSPNQTRQTSIAAGVHPLLCVSAHCSGTRSRVLILKRGAIGRDRLLKTRRPALALSKPKERTAQIVLRVRPFRSVAPRKSLAKVFKFAQNSPRAPV